MTTSIHSPIERRALDHSVTTLSAVLLLLTIALAVWNQVLLLDYLEWGDESETIVASKMLAAGMALYSQVFNHHGPLTFLPGYALERFGSFGVREHRVVVAALQAVALGSLYVSPLLRGRLSRQLMLPITITAIVIFMPLSNLWGHTYIYQVLAGLLLVVVLAQYTLPSLIDPASLTRAGVILGSVGIASLPWLAITYLPAAALLFICSLRRSFLQPALLAALGAAAANLAFLGLIGSYKGYLAFHIYLNSQILPAYNSGHGPIQMAGRAFGALTGFYGTIDVWIAFVGLAAVFAGLLADRSGRLSWRPVFFGVALLTLLARGMTHHGAPFWYACIALGTVSLVRLDLARPQRALWLVVACCCVLRLAYPIFVDNRSYTMGARKEVTEFGQLARQLTNPNDKVIAWSFQNFEYLAADRLPASGHFFYLPWQQKYNDAPKLGIVIDACHDIAEHKPKVMLIDKWVVWNRHPWESYSECVQSIIDRDYRQIPGHPIYVRSELFDQAMQLIQKEPRPATR